MTVLGFTLATVPKLDWTVTLSGSRYVPAAEMVLSEARQLTRLLSSSAWLVMVAFTSTSANPKSEFTRIRFRLNRSVYPSSVMGTSLMDLERTGFNATST